MSRALELEENCIFCKILNEELPGSIVYEDDEIAVLVDMFPINKGHLLIIPKIHSVYIEDVAPDTLSVMMLKAQELGVALKKSAIGAEGFNLLLSDGQCAGQEIAHAHLHVVPRYSGDKFGFKFDATLHNLETQRSEMDEIAAEIKNHL